MSHFAVMVITEEEPTQDVLAKILQPWHEYECTGIEDEYVVDVDVSDRMEKVWNEPCKVLKLADGTIVSKYNQKFWHKPDGDDIFAHEEFKMPEGATEIEIPRHELAAIEGQTKVDYAEEYGGWKFRDGKFWERTNPNAKWDWWVVGGRYSGRLQVVPGVNARVGERSWTNEDQHIRGVDQAQRRDLDLAAMKAEAENGRREWVQDCCERTELTMADFETAIKTDHIVHPEWMEIDEALRPRGVDYYEWLEAKGGDCVTLAAFKKKCFELPPVPKGSTLEQWISSAPPISAWAVVKDGEWHEKGEMGWWGMSSGDKDNWDEIFTKLWEQVPDDHWVSFVDCHI